VTTHARKKSLRYQSAKYKKSNIKEVEDTTTTQKQPQLEVLPGVTDYLAKVMKEGRPVYVVYANRNPDEKKVKKIKPTT
jgi:endo-alpha-1,4-polygalactosaminidase (GH114 family)